MQIHRIALIGAGNMARGLIGGLLRAPGFEAQGIAVADPVAEQLAQVTAQFGVRVTRSNTEAIANAQLIILAVKPQEMVAVMTELKPALLAAGEQGPLILSIAAGIRTEMIVQALGGGARVVRAMPNRPALMGYGVTALFASPAVVPAERSAVQTVLEAVGEVVWVAREELMDAVTAVSGTGPAYFFLLMELLENAAVEQGLSPEVARKLSIETAYGSAVMARERKAGHYLNPEQLRAEVTSKGGTTAAAMAVLEPAGVRDIMNRAVAAAAQRSRELAEELGKS